MKLVVVVWEDAHAETTAWQSMSTNTEEGYAVVSTGVLLDKATGQKTSHLSLAMSVSCDAFMDCVLHIPEQMVKEVIELGEAQIEHGKVIIHKKGRKRGTNVPQTSRSKR